MDETLLSIRGLKTYFFTKDGIVKAVDDVDLNINKGHIVGIVGESGCGKSTIALSIMRLVQKPGRILGGEIQFEGKDLLRLTDNEIRSMRGREISMIFQDATSSLNPVYKIGDQIGEVIKLHQMVKDTREKKEKVIEVLSKVGIPDGERRYSEYPHEFSGGMKQRVMIAMAVSCNPKLLLMDEPTTSLDVTTQAQVLDVVKNLIQDRGISVLLITHNLGLVAEMCDYVYVMYAGKIIESADCLTIFNNAKHPYTSLLMRAIPNMIERKGRLASIPGTVPELINIPPGCIFADRCNLASDECRKESPKAMQYEPGHMVACIGLKKKDLKEAIEDASS